jgi:ElaB/YqjD/DUF883 family membrane-anchored ribosome-binding protein
VDEGTRQGEAVDGEAAADAAQDPQELRREIEHTREELGDTVAALAEKTDVKAQARHKVDDVKETASSKKDELVSKAREVTPASAQQGIHSAADAARRNPLPAGIAAALATGVLIGYLVGRR